MEELLRSTDVVFISFIEAALKAEGIETVVLDAAMSATEGSISAFPRRLMVRAQDYARAKSMLTQLRDAGFD